MMPSHEDRVDLRSRDGARLVQSSSPRSKTPEMSHSRRVWMRRIVAMSAFVSILVTSFPAQAGHCYSTAFLPVLYPAPQLTIRGRGTTTCDGSYSGVLHQTKIKRWNGTFWSTEHAVNDSVAPLDAFTKVICATTTSSEWRTDADSDHNGADLSPSGVFYNCREA
jgi:hypothetical protein